MRFIQYLAAIALSSILLAGCGRHYHPLEAGKKAKMAAELINSDPKCEYLKDRLANPNIGDDAIDDVYRDAMKAQCIKKDI